MAAQLKLVVRRYGRSNTSWRSSLVLVVAMLVARGSHHVAGPIIAAAAFLSFLFFWKRRPGRVEELSRETDARLGADGLWLEDRFVPSSTFDTLQGGHDTFIVIADGKRYDLRGNDVELGRARAIAASMRAARSDGDGRAVPAALREQLGAPPDQDAGVHYRVAAIDPERRLALAEDPRVEPRVRIAAATSLGEPKVLSEEVRERLARAAEDSAHPEVRDAMLRASRGA